jgi:DNA-binding LacI/PurR family transcriptional regulator
MSRPVIREVVAVAEVATRTISGRQPAQPHRVFAPELVIRSSTGGVRTGAV